MMALLSVPTLAQYEQTGGFARLQGMGNNPYIIDPYFMTVNPAWGGHYRNFLFGDLGSSNGAFQSGGVGQFIAANFHVGGGLSLGGMLTRNDFLGLSISRLDPFGIVGQLNSFSGSPQAIPALNNNLELFGSYKAGSTAFGFGFAFASTTSEINTPIPASNFTSSGSQIGFNAGIVTKLTSKFMLDAGASLILPSATHEPGVGNMSEITQTIILVNARAFYNYSSKVAFVPSFGFATASGTVENGTSATPTSTDLASLTLIALGIGVNYQVGDFLLSGGPAFATISSTTSSTPTTPELVNSAFVFPIWNLGVEWNMNDWFVARFGYIATIQKVTNESNANQTPEINDVSERIITQFQGPQGATVGVGFRLGNFSLDATVNEDVLRQGLNNLGGNGAGAATFAYLSLSYAMP
jgi:hypothetical protein